MGPAPVAAAAGHGAGPAAPPLPPLEPTVGARIATAVPLAAGVVEEGEPREVEIGGDSVRVR